MVFDHLLTSGQPASGSELHLLGDGFVFLSHPLANKVWPRARSAQRRRSQPAFIIIMIIKLVSVAGARVRFDQRSTRGFDPLADKARAHATNMHRYVPVCTGVMMHEFARFQEVWSGIGRAASARGSAAQRATAPRGAGPFDPTLDRSHGFDPPFDRRSNAFGGGQGRRACGGRPRVQPRVLMGAPAAQTMIADHSGP
jgi:hypothetical protein